MKSLFLYFVAFTLFSATSFAFSHDQPDSVYLFSYATDKNKNKNGLHFAWSPDKKNWLTIGNEFSFLRSDFGRWGPQKRMLTPTLMQGPDGTWHCIWALNEIDPYFAHAASADLICWGRQSYPTITKGTTFIRPVVKYSAADASYVITYASNDSKYYRVTTKDFKTYSTPVEVNATQYVSPDITITLPEGKATGQVTRVSWAMVDRLIKNYELRQYRNSLSGETTKQDSIRFAGLKPVEATVTLQPDKKHPVSDVLLGVFFEDLNYAADGGLYAELIQNRDFEYKLSDKEGRDKNWTSKYAWTLKGEGTTFSVDSINPIHANNPHYATLTISTPGASLVNTGYDSIVTRKGEQYNLTLLAKRSGTKSNKLQVRLVSRKGTILATTTLNVASAEWKKIEATLTASADADDAQLELQPLADGTVMLDMISLFPQKTFKGRKNGLRADLAQTIADIHPRFIRFPGGCLAHGDGIGNIYQWKNSVGPLEARKPMRNLWGYHQTTGLGYFEYFQFCEDIGATPVPVVAAGVPCQNSGTGGHGQQGGIPMSEMDDYIQDILDLIEYANGDAKTTWGKKRAEAGHPGPFNLKYIGIGNEDLITDIFEERFSMIYKVMQEKHPEITVIGTVGPASEGTDYREGWEIASRLNVPMVDEHYYQSPGWFIYNQEFYDQYDRTKSKVYLGEYAAHLAGRPNNIETALAEALYLTALERNGDVVHMASYAPLLAKEGHTQWNPDLIYFNNKEVKPTVGYQVQKLYGANAGNEYLPASITLSNTQDAVKKRIACSIVRDTKTNDIIIKLVNLLPTSVQTTIDLKDITPTGTTATRTVLQGKPTDKIAMPTQTIETVNDILKNELLPYSLTIIRIPTK